ncbi:hypothetical protein LJC33_00195 [Eubacteriales bacterium OttesenSCG-928-N13]|nr:hypothetical protein [Eubacteriales bacterium OttesenSCG-928-N13]
MKLSKIIKQLFVLVVLVAWVGCAALNLMQQLPSLTSAYGRNWVLEEKVDALVEAANGSVMSQSVLQNANGAISRLLERQTINGFSIAQGEDGQLAYTNFYPYETYDYEEPALRMKQLAQAAEAQGATFFYLNCLDVYQEEGSAFGELPINNLNPRADAFLRALQGYGVDYVDARELLRENPLAAEDYVYKTEPHWRTETCFEAYLGLVEELKRRGSGIDPNGFYTSSQGFTRTEYPQQYLGKLGKITGATFAGYDDFTLIAPAFQTDLTLSYEEYDLHSTRQGDFGTTLLDSRWLGNDDIYDNDMYCVYLTEVYPYRKITNNLNPDGPKVLIVGDSFMLPVAAFMAVAAGELHLLSPYSLPSDVASLPEYLQANGFDHVIVGLNAGTLYDSGFNFLNGIELPELP